jgi:3-phytase
VDVVAAANQTTAGVALYALDAATRRVRSLGGFPTQVGPIIGVALYRGAGGLWVFAVASTGQVEQYALTDDGVGHLTGSVVRQFALSSGAEGVTVDDQTGMLYVAEDAVGLWRFSASPDGGTARTLVDATDGGHLSAPVKGLAVYQASGGLGYLLASQPSTATYAVYSRVDGTYLTAFGLTRDGGLEAPNQSLSVTVTNVALDGTFPAGLFVAQDSRNDVGSNLKLVGWGAIAPDAGLIVDTAFNPRRGTDAGTNSDGGAADAGGSHGSGGPHVYGNPPGPKYGCNCRAPGATGASGWLWVLGLLSARGLIWRRKPR